MKNIKFELKTEFLLFVLQVFKNEQDRDKSKKYHGLHRSDLSIIANYLL